MLALRPLLLSAFALLLFWYLYGAFFAVSQAKTTYSFNQDYSSFLQAIKSSKPSNTVHSSAKPVQRTTAPIVPERAQTDLVTDKEYHLGKNKTNMRLCDVPPDLGPIPANTSHMLLEEVVKKYSEVHWGGWYSPPNCTVSHKVAIIVPYRDRKTNLAIFLNHMHPFLMKQKLEYRIFIVEQQGIRDHPYHSLLRII